MDQTPLSMCVPQNSSINITIPAADQDYKRKPNFSDAEKIFLIEQYSVFKEPLSSRLADVTTVKRKQEIWTFIAAELNRYNPTVERTAKETRKKWENLTSMARKEMAEFRSGCLRGKSPSAITLRVLEVIEDIVFTAQNIKVEDGQNSDDSTLNDGIHFDSRNEHSEINHSMPGLNFQPTMANLIFSANSPSLTSGGAVVDNQSPLPVSSSNGQPNNMPPLPKLTVGQQNLFSQIKNNGQKRAYSQPNGENAIGYSNKRKFIARIEQQGVEENGRLMSFKKRKRRLELERMELENEKLRLEIELLRDKLKNGRHQDGKQDDQSQIVDQSD